MISGLATSKAKVMRPVSIGSSRQDGWQTTLFQKDRRACGEPEETYQPNNAISKHGRNGFSKATCTSAKVNRAESVAASNTRNQTVSEGCDKAKGKKIGERCVEPENRGQQTPAIRGQHQGRQVDTYRSSEVGRPLARD